MKKTYFVLAVILTCISNSGFIATAFGQNKAIQFAFGTPYITVTNGGVSSPFNITTGDLTLEAWIMPTGFVTSSNNHEHTILGNDSIVTGSGGGYVLRTGGSKKLSFSFYNGSWQEVATTGSVLEANAWQHVAVTKLGNAVKLYLNGVVVASTTISGNQNIYSSQKRMRFGENGTASNRRFIGRIDEVKIWDIARTQAEVQTDGREICGSFPPSLIAYYKLDDIGSLSSNPILCVNAPTLDGVINGPIQSVGGAVLYPTNVTDLYVDSANIATSCGLHDGSAWSTAFTDLYTALLVAQHNTSILKIHVAKGTYHPMLNAFNMQVSGIGTEMTSNVNSDKTFDIRQGLELYGGYPSGGGIAMPSLHKSVLDGSFAGGGLADTAYNVVYMNGSGSWPNANDTSKLIGFTVRNGVANLNGGLNLGAGSAAGIWCDYNISLIQNCVVTNNKSLNIGAGIVGNNATMVILDDTVINNRPIGINNGYGISTSQCDVELANCYIARNSTVGASCYRGNIKIHDNVVEDNIGTGITQSEVYSSEIYHNIARRNGANGINAHQCDWVAITDNLVEDNQSSGVRLYGGTQLVARNIIRRDTAALGGGIYCYNGYNTLVGNFISDNFATGVGGGIYTDIGFVRIDSNVIINNSAYQGGGLHLNSSTDTVSNNIIIHNTASNVAGGAEFDAVYSTVVNNVIAENNAPQVGGAKLNCLTMRFANNTVFNNHATDDSYSWNGGGLLISNGQIKMYNNIIWKNKLGTSDIVPKADFYNTNANCTFKHTSLQRVSSSYTTVGSGDFDIGVNAVNNYFVIDPMFASPASIAGADGVLGTSDDGLQLLNTSPFVDAGADSLLPAYFSEDVIGAQRIYGSSINMGAYELGCAPANITPLQQSVLCSNGSTLLQANTAAPPSDVKWYADSTSTTVLGTGYSFTTPVLTTADTFWVGVDNCASTARIPVIITMSASSFGTQNAVACDSFLWALTGLYYTASGTYYDTIANTMGCDSFITLTLVVNNSTIGVQSVTACGSYFWNVTGLTYATTGTYFDTIPNTIGCDSFVTLNLTINNANATITQTGQVLQANVGATSYQWLTCGPYALIPGATSSSYTVTSSGSYAVVIVENGCTDTSTCFPVTLGVQELAKEGAILMTPNPAHNSVSILLPPSVGMANLHVRNAFGQMVLQLPVKGGQPIIVDLSTLATGVYQVECSDGVQRYRGKLLKL